ncbi:MAG: M48 family metalloprotease [Candidatus Magasanikbacteria bacterium]|nr:M48 family metalloprotease [Candidatus Magasanikbacteria bacterium]
MNELKVNETITESWKSFFLSFMMLSGFWVIFFFIFARFFPGMIRLYVGATVLATIVGVLLLLFNELMVRLFMDLKRVEEREQAEILWDVVHEICEQIKCSCPRIYISEVKETNAFAFGLGIFGSSAVGATRGIIDELSREELKAVMAHEIGHIQNRDLIVSIMMTIAAMTFAFSGWLVKEYGPYFISSENDSGKSDSKSESNGIGYIIFCIIVIPILGAIVYYFGRLFAYVLQMYVSRKREYAADAFSTRTMGNSDYLVTALEKIVRNPAIGSRRVNAAFGFLCTADPDVSDFLSTHPAFDKRIEALHGLMQ